MMQHVIILNGIGRFVSSDKVTKVLSWLIPFRFKH